MPEKGRSDPKSLIVRVTPETYAALQLSQPFGEQSSMQDVLAMLIDRYLSELTASDPGFERALDGLKESRARRHGVLARRAVRKTSNRG
jgi:hypothetical protein